MSQADSSDSGWMRRQRAAEFLGISVRRLDDLVAEGAIPTYRPTPRRVLIARADLVAFLASRRFGGAPR